MFDLTSIDNEKQWLRDLDIFDRNLFASPIAKVPFKTDILDQGQAYVMQAELPGFKKEDIKVDLNGEYLVIKAVQEKSQVQCQDESCNYLRKERNYGSYERSFHIPNVDLEKIEATYVNGVLNVTMPKMNKQKEAVKTINIK